jgi:predicted phosphoadenosine phosphosulfate sulfurtransferase
MDSKRVPSWKAIAMAILRNDHNMHSLGFNSVETEGSEQLLKSARGVKSGQMELTLVREVRSI